jgi:hypothetical protein
MDADRSGRAMTDTAIDREIQAALAVDPSPEFVARVRTRIAAVPAGASSWLSWKLVVSGSLAALIVVTFVLMRPFEEPFNARPEPFDSPRGTLQSRPPSATTTATTQLRRADQPPPRLRRSAEASAKGGSAAGAKTLQFRFVLVQVRLFVLVLQLVEFLVGCAEFVLSVGICVGFLFGLLVNLGFEIVVVFVHASPGPFVVRLRQEPLHLRKKIGHDWLLRVACNARAQVSKMLLICLVTAAPPVGAQPATLCRSSRIQRMR